MYDSAERTALEREIIAYNPWLEDVGLVSLMVDLIESGASEDEILSKLRASKEYQAAFPGYKDKDGKVRFDSEAHYLSTIRDYKDVLAEFGAPASKSDDPSDFLGFIEGSVDPGELKQRFTVYRDLEVSGKEVRDAFFVYSGLRITTDDLYEAVISPEYAQKLTETYDQATLVPLSWPTYVARVTQVGLENLQGAGELPPGGVDSTVAQQLVGVLANSSNFQGGAGGSPGPVPGVPEDPAGSGIYTSKAERTGGTGMLSLSELIAAFEVAIIGSAATTQGLKLPSLEKAQELRVAGITRAQAMQQYGLYAKMGEGFSGMVQRANLGTKLDQSTFEDAALLGKVTAQALFEQAIAQEQNLARAEGTFNTQLDRSGRITQSGRI